jgi:hypothetical protein
MANPPRGDIAEVQTTEGKLYLFVGIDRTRKFAVAHLVEKSGGRPARLSVSVDMEGDSIHGEGIRGPIKRSPDRTLTTEDRGGLSEGHLGDNGARWFK